jgi:hypothetical protein
MTENEDQKINLTCLFLVTAASFALFALVLNFLDGQNNKLLWWISRISFILGSLSATYAWLNKTKSTTGKNPE